MKYCDHEHHLYPSLLTLFPRDLSFQSQPNATTPKETNSPHPTKTSNRSFHKTKKHESASHKVHNIHISRSTAKDFQISNLDVIPFYYKPTKHHASNTKKVPISNLPHLFLPSRFPLLILQIPCSPIGIVRIKRVICCIVFLHLFFILSLATCRCRC